MESFARLLRCGKPAWSHCGPAPACTSRVAYARPGASRVSKTGRAAPPPWCRFTSDGARSSRVAGAASTLTTRLSGRTDMDPSAPRYARLHSNSEQWKESAYLERAADVPNDALTRRETRDIAGEPIARTRRRDPAGISPGLRAAGQRRTRRAHRSLAFDGQSTDADAGRRRDAATGTSPSALSARARRPEPGACNAQQVDRASSRLPR